MPPTTTLLGQAGLLLTDARTRLLIDPYLTDSVADQFGSHLRRLVPCPIEAADLQATDWVLITHEHLDHCDPGSIRAIREAAPQARFVGPAPVRRRLAEIGVPESLLTRAGNGWLALAPHLRVHAVPAAHPDLRDDGEGAWECVGYVLEWGTTRWYHAGDTSPHQAIVDAVRPLAPTLGFLPVNERNYYRDRADILGNMSLREAFALADEIGLETIVPIHWDLFAPNTTPREEIELMHRLLAPRCALRFAP